MACFLWIALWIYCNSPCLGENHTHVFRNFLTLDMKMCQINDEIFHKEAIDEIMCVARCADSPSCVSVFYKEASKQCTGCKAVYYNRTTLPNEFGTKYYLDTQVTSGWEFFKGGYYKLSTELEYAWLAEAKCRGLGSHLAKVDSAEEINFLEELLKAANVDKATIGLTDEHNEGDFRWLVDGSKPNYENWGYNLPTGSRMFNCVLILKELDYKWMDISCDHFGAHYVCAKRVREF